MDLQLTGRVVLVVGGHGLIGSAVTKTLRAEHALAIPASRHAADGLVMDATSDASVGAAVEKVLETYGRLDGLVVTAAPSARTLDQTRNSDPVQVAQAVEDKAVTFLRLANAVLPTMRQAGHGRVVGVSGQNAFITGNITGSVRNAALIIIAKSLADSVAGSGVTVNAVSPGVVVENPAVEVPLGRSGQCTPEDVANLVAYLVSPLSAAVSGESLAVGHRVNGATGL